MNTVKQKSVGVSLILTIVTCGIYGLFWLASLVNDICDLKGVERTGGRDILLTIVTCGLYSIYLLYKMGADIDEIKYSRGLNTGNNGIIYLILSLVGLGIVAYALTQNSINELC